MTGKMPASQHGPDETKSFSQQEIKLNTGSELHVIKAILLREDYLRRLKKLAVHSKGQMLPGFVDFVDIIRLASVEVVEAIVMWRKQLQPKHVNKGSSKPFKWNGFNYLLKMVSDLDYLNNYTHLTHWFGFSLERNPFIIPLSMENCPIDEGECGIFCLN